MRDEPVDALLVHPRALDALGPARRRADEQHVALADQLVGAGLVEDHTRVGDARHRERETARDVGLDHAGDHVDRRPLRRDHEVDTHGARHLGDATHAGFDVPGRHHHQVVQLVDDDEDVRQALESTTRHGVGLVRRRKVATIEGCVVPGDVAHTGVGEQLVTQVHLAHGPVERVGRLLRVGHDRREQVRQLVVATELDALGVDEDHAYLVGCGAHQDRRDDRVDAARFPGAGRTRDQEVGHGGEIEHHRLTRDVAPQSDLERMRGLPGVVGGEEVAQRHKLALPVRHLDADRAPPRDGGEDAHVG